MIIFIQGLFGEGEGPILDDLQCNGQEVSLMACSHSQPGIHDCAHSEDAGVICRPTGKWVAPFDYLICTHSF